MLKTTINANSQQGGGGLQSNKDNGLSSIYTFVKGLLNFKHFLTKFFAFTLAETLIVIGIIGVVASLTIPNLNSTTADKEKITKVKKVYAQLNEAFERAQAVYGPFDEWVAGDMSEEEVTKISERLMEFMKISKNCELSTDKGCFSGQRDVKSYLTGDVAMENVDELDNVYKFVLSDGTSVAVYPGFGYFILVNIDPKASPVYGKNIFNFIIFSKNIYSGFINEDVCNGQICLTPKIPSQYVGVESYADWIIQHGNMDYLKTDASGKCKDSDIVLDGTANTSCK